MRDAVEKALVTLVTGNEQAAEVKAGQERQQIPNAEKTEVTGGNYEVTEVTEPEKTHQKLDLPLTAFKVGDRVEVTCGCNMGYRGKVSDIDLACSTPYLVYSDLNLFSNWYSAASLRKLDDGGDSNPSDVPPPAPTPTAENTAESNSNATHPLIFAVGDLVVVIRGKDRGRRGHIDGIDESGTHYGSELRPVSRTGD